jgi:hypothetical protein
MHTSGELVPIIHIMSNYIKRSAATFLLLASSALAQQTIPLDEASTAFTLARQSFNPNDLVPLDDTSTLYRALRAPPGPAPADAATLSSEGWKLNFKAAYQVVPGARPGDLLVQPR